MKSQGIFVVDLNINMLLTDNRMYDTLFSSLGRSTISSKSQPRGKINFIAAKQKKISEKVASKTRRRGQVRSLLCFSGCTRLIWLKIKK